MALVTFNRQTFEKEIGKLDEKMQEKISMFGTPLESFNENELIIEIFPNRPDLLSYHGYKRSFLSFLGKTMGLKEYKINKPEKDYLIEIDKQVKNIRPYTACAIVKGLELNNERIKEIIELQEKLHITVGRKRKKLAIGIYPLEKIKLPIHYTALEPDKIRFIPLESEKEMSGLEILQKHPAGKEYSNLLAGKAKFPIFIDAEKNILSMPPIINSKLTGKITEETKDVFVECSGFDFEALKSCLNIIVASLADIGGNIYQMELKYNKKEITPDFSNEKMKISLENTNKLLGIELSEKKLKECAEKMGYNYNKGYVEISPWRMDILHEVDIIEDIAIAYGYESFEPEIPFIPTIGEEDYKEKIKRKISEILTGLNILEVSNYHLTTKKDQFEKIGINEKQKKEFIEVKDSKTDYRILRKDLTHYALKILSENVDAEYPHRIFEIGKVFEANDEIVEKEKLSVAFSPGNFTETRQVLEYLFKMLSLKVELKEPKNYPNYFIDGRIAEIFLIDNEKRGTNPILKLPPGISTIGEQIQETIMNINKRVGLYQEKTKSLGFIGEIHPKILRNWKIKMPVALFEISLEEVLSILNKP